MIKQNTKPEDNLVEENKEDLQETEQLFVTGSELQITNTDRKVSKKIEFESQFLAVTQEVEEEDGKISDSKQISIPIKGFNEKFQVDKKEQMLLSKYQELKIEEVSEIYKEMGRNISK